MPARSRWLFQGGSVCDIGRRTLFKDVRSALGMQDTHSAIENFDNSFVIHDFLNTLRYAKSMDITSAACRLLLRHGSRMQT